MPDLVAEGLRRKIGDFALEASFCIPEGKRYALVGGSGSGKTSLLRVLAGLDLADSGALRLGDADLTGLPPQRREVGYVFQDAALFPRLDVLGNAVFGLRMRGVPRAEREERGMSWLERVGLADKARSETGRLSGGERSRVAFVRAVIWKPSYLLLDEPFSALDSGLRASVREALVELHAACPVPLLLVTHDEQDVAALAHARLELRVSPDGLQRSILSP